MGFNRKEELQFMEVLDMGNEGREKGRRRG